MHGWISFYHHRRRSGGLAFPLLRRHAKSHVDLNVFDRKTNFPRVYTRRSVGELEDGS
jgi:hypothetical protein